MSRPRTIFKAGDVIRQEDHKRLTIVLGVEPRIASWDTGDDRSYKLASIDNNGKTTVCGQTMGWSRPEIVTGEERDRFIEEYNALKALEDL